MGLYLGLMHLVVSPHRMMLNSTAAHATLQRSTGARTIKPEIPELGLASRSTQNSSWRSDCDAVCRSRPTYPRPTSRTANAVTLVRAA
jgi:hypothetical protein